MTRTGLSRARPSGLNVAQAVGDELAPLAKIKQQADLYLVDASPRVVLYGRVSSDGQKEDMTIRIQQGELRAEVKTREASLVRRVRCVGEFWDDGLSGTIPFEERPESKRLMALICQEGDIHCKGERCRSQIDQIWIAKLDRLARTLLIIVGVEAFLRAHRVYIRALDFDLDTSSHMGQMLFHIIGAIAEWERKTIVDRGKGGIHENARDGKWPGGRVPFGLKVVDGRAVQDDTLFTIEDGHIVVDDLVVTRASEAAYRIVQSIFENVALNGATTFTEAARTGLTRKVVNSMLHNRRYIGDGSITEGGKTFVKRALDNGRAAPKVVGTGATFPSLVTEELFEQAAAALTGNRKNASRNRQYDYLLSRQLTCAHCGRVYTGRIANAGVNVYYYCTKQECQGKSINGRVAEAEVWKLVQQAYLDPDSLIGEVERTTASDQLPALQAELDSLTASLANIAAEREMVNRRVEQGRRSEAEGDQRLDELAKDAEPLTRRRDLLRLEVRAAIDARAATFRGVLKPADAAEEIAHINATNDRAAMRKIIAGTLIKAEVVSHLNRKQPFLKLILAVGRDLSMSVALPSPGIGADYQQVLVSVTLLGSGA